MSNVTNALSGKMAGVQTMSSNGQPGVGSSVLIRGVGSINGSTAPLYVVDGFPYDGSMSDIAAGDIESITVLKDAASTALYGARGANGVIMITTKKGKEGAAQITFDARWGGNSRALSNYDVITDPGEYFETLYRSFYTTRYMDARLAAMYSQPTAMPITASGVLWVSALLACPMVRTSSVSTASSIPMPLRVTATETTTIRLTTGPTKHSAPVCVRTTP